MPGRGFRLALQVLLFMILTLMALGAGVRAMNAGLSCPDWPLCFGQVIPDYHPGVYFEFIHRAYAGLTALMFFGCCVYVFRSRELPAAAKRVAAFGLVALLAQIVMGGLTVLKLVKDYIVTSHLMLATVFFSAVLWLYFQSGLQSGAAVKRGRAPAPKWVKTTTLALAVLVFVQIFIGGLVASTYSGSVCVDWPLCNGQWFPTWRGAIGLQIIHRMVAYGLALVVLATATVFYKLRGRPWMTWQFMRLNYTNVLIVLVQIAVGVANLLLYIPPIVTVLHQSMGVILLAVNLRLFFVASVLTLPALPNQPALKPEPEAYPVGSPARLS